MIYPIRLYGDPVLRKVARPVTHFGEDLKALAEDMKETMHDANGVGLAAPQIGLSLRIFVAAELARSPQQDAPAEAEADEVQIVAEHVMVNPEITLREGVQYGQDGCLSIPGIAVEQLKRDARIQLRYQDLDGTPQALEASGHFAHVIQHEFDHLNGVLFFDHMPEEEKRQFMRTHRRELAEIQRDAKALLKQLKQDPIPAAQVG